MKVDRTPSERFLQPEVLQRCAVELTKRKQNHSESISDYVVALRNLSNQSFADNEKAHVSDWMLCGIFMEGVVPNTDNL